MPKLLISSANAREYAAKSALVRKAHAEASVRAEPVPKPPIAQAEPSEPDYGERRLTRVRKQLDILDKRIRITVMAPDLDGQLLNWLCSAQERLSEQERLLADRPLPGTKKPSQARPVRQLPTGPIGLQPAPTEPLPPEPPPN